MTIPENTAIIGKIPGYNANIDSTHEFEQELLKGVTFVDLRPMTYQLGTAIGGSTSTGAIDNVLNFFDGVFNDLVKAQKMNGLFKKDSTVSKEVFRRVLDRMQDDFKLSEDFADKDMIRIVCANDSTFTEQFSNSFGGENGIATMVNAAKTKWSDSKMGFLQKGLKSYSHADMIDLAGSMHNATSGLGASASDIATGVAFGMNIATPTTWDSSQYTSTLSVFLKLVAPIGTEECVQRNIVEPMMYLLAASSPLTYSGLMYGFPLLWDVQAHGITNFRIGAIAALSFIRGSFETTFNTNLQPTVIDVRLTIVPLLNDFAVQPDDSIDSDVFTDSIYKNPDSLGVQNPLDVWTGTMNRHPNASRKSDSTILTIKL